MQTHKHIPFKYGHITWTGKKLPTEEQMQVFNKMAERVLQDSEELSKLHSIDIPLSDKITDYIVSDVMKNDISNPFRSIKAHNYYIKYNITAGSIDELMKGKSIFIDEIISVESQKKVEQSMLNFITRKVNNKINDIHSKLYDQYEYGDY